MRPIFITAPLLLTGLIACIAPTSAGAQTLQATATVSVSNNIWNYTLVNMEPTGSGNWLTDFYLPINAPITDVQTANGWQVSTDYQNYIEWSNIEAFPYPNDIAPGLSVSGFSFMSVATSGSAEYTLSSWDHGADAAGPIAVDTILSPSAPAAVPEASTALSLSLGLLPLGVFAVRRRLKRKTASS